MSTDTAANTAVLTTEQPSGVAVETEDEDDGEEEDDNESEHDFAVKSVT